MTGTENIHGDADEIQHHRRHIEHVVGPVAPAGEKAVEVAEDFFGPKIDSALSGIAVSEFDYGDALRPEKKNKRDEPEPHRDPTVGGYGGNYVQVEDCYYKQENQVAASEDALQVGGGLVGGGQSPMKTSVDRSAEALRHPNALPGWPRFDLARRLLASLGGQATRLSLHEPYRSHRVLQSSRDRGARGADKQCQPRVKQSSSAQPRPVGLRVPVVLSLAMRRCRRRPPGACRYRRRCAGRKWSIVHPTSTVAPSRRVHHREPVVPPEVDVDGGPVAVVANFLRIKHERTVYAGTGNVGL